jgi:hypothetical protein
MLMPRRGGRSGALRRNPEGRIAMKRAWLILVLLLSPLVAAQNTVPAGTVLPIRLDTGLNAAKITSGKAIRAQVMQDIPGTSIHRGAKVFGHVVSVTPRRIELSFDTLVQKGQRIPLKTNLRAIASMLEVNDAQIPEGGADRALPSALDLTTRQIGGDMVYRGGGPVARGNETVGESTAYGVLGHLNSNPPCRAAVDDNHNVQALWLFSTDACGVYGFNDLAIEHSGRTDPVGTIILVSKTDKINIRTGSGLLLRVQAPNATAENHGGTV